jgi:hypothetical protein
MAGLTYQVTGLGEIQAKLGKISDIAMNKIYIATSEATRQCYQWSQDACPVLTGDLKRSGTYDVIELGPLAVEGTVTYGDDQVDYAVFVELGTNRMAAQPYLYPAYLDALDLWQLDLRAIQLGDVQ